MANVVSPRVSMILNNALQETGETWSEFIRRFHKEHGEVGAKNHLFKILNGSTIAGEIGLMPLICKSLKLDYKTMQQAIRDDKMEAKGWVKPVTNKIVHEITARLGTLPHADQVEVLKIVKMKGGIVS